MNRYSTCVSCGQGIQCETTGRLRMYCDKCRLVIRNPCSINGCNRPRHARGWCGTHYRRWAKHGDPEALILVKPGETTGQFQRWRKVRVATCLVNGCNEPHLSRGWCNAHYQRWVKYGDPEREYRPENAWYINTSNGYVTRSKLGSKVHSNELQHRVIMEDLLGRPLFNFENVHHKNGIRHDNRPENLEVWCKPQPCGQRPEDLVQWVIETYPELVRIMMLENQ